MERLRKLINIIYNNEVEDITKEQMEEYREEFQFLLILRNILENK